MALRVEKAETNERSRHGSQPGRTEAVLQSSSGATAFTVRGMGNVRDLQAELRRHNLLKPLVELQIIAEAVGYAEVTHEELETARNHFLENNDLKDAQAITTFLAGHGMNAEDFEWQIALPHRIKHHCQQQFLHKAEAHFLTRKNQLDKVVYSLLRTKDAFLAQELFLRIDGGESNFGDLAAQFSEGPERNTKGIVGPVPLTQAHPTIAELLRTTKPGVLLHPLRLGDLWIVMRLENYSPASFDDAMATQMSRELFDQWVNEELSRRMKLENPLCVPTTAE